MKTTLYTETSGAGQDLVLIHGWGLHGGVFNEFSKKLEPHFRVTRVDLPGYGHSDAVDSYALADLARLVQQSVPEQAIWMGWSLGGLIAQRAAIDQLPLKAIALISSTPKFTADATWPFGTSPDVLQKFTDELKENYRRTILQFLSIQAMGSIKAKEEIRLLRDLLFSRKDPDHLALEKTLSLLQNEDLISELGKIQIPCVAIFGAKDRLVHPETSDLFKKHCKTASTQIIPAAGHAAFISHPGVVRHILMELNQALLPQGEG